MLEKLNVHKIFIPLLATLILGCASPKPALNEPTPIAFDWKRATIYFLMTDRFMNGDTANDYTHFTDLPPAPYRGFMGGDLKGVSQKIEEGYFNELGVDAIWFTPIVEQIKGAVDEGTGTSYPFHGYWTRDWTALDARFGSKEDLRNLIETAHAHNIRVIIDAVANHTGPVTPLDAQWPDAWVKTGPQCTFEGYESVVNCTLVKNLPDVKTESTEAVELPEFLVEKWKMEGRLAEEQAELETWFTKTGFPRTPVHYILKWLVDFIKEFGIDGFRVDTAKHTEAYVWSDLRKAADQAFEHWKAENPRNKLIDDAPFYMVGEVYNYMATQGLDFNYNDSIVNFYDFGFDALINFDFKDNAVSDYDSLFIMYGGLTENSFQKKSFVNYISSHDDGSPFDKHREHAITAGTKLLLSPGSIQIYYGDETARRLDVEGKGDAILRSFMNWDELEANTIRNGTAVRDVQHHWRKLGKFRQNHPAIADGVHVKISDTPYTFSRQFLKNEAADQVVVALDAPIGEKTIHTNEVFPEGTQLFDYYGGVSCIVKDNKVVLESSETIVLLAKE